MVSKPVIWPPMPVKRSGGAAGLRAEFKHAAAAPAGHGAGKDRAAVYDEIIGETCAETHRARSSDDGPGIDDGASVHFDAGRPARDHAVSEIGDHPPGGKIHAETAAVDITGVAEGRGKVRRCHALVGAR